MKHLPENFDELTGPIDERHFHNPGTDSLIAAIKAAKPDTVTVPQSAAQVSGRARRRNSKPTQSLDRFIDEALAKQAARRKARG